MAFTFGSPPAAPPGAPSGGSLTGATSTAFSFHASNPAPVNSPAGGISNPPAFGSSFGASGSNAGAVPGINSVTQVAVVSCGTPYSALPADIRQAIDRIHDAMMKHKRTVNAFHSMGPSLLLPEDVGAERAAPGSSSATVSLPVLIRQLHEAISDLERESCLQAVADSCKEEYEALLKQSIVQGLWQLEALAIRRGVHLRSVRSDRKQQESLDSKSQLQDVLDRQMAHVDRFERMPCPYLWQVLEDTKKRLLNLERRMWTVQQQSQNAFRTEEPTAYKQLIQQQMQQVTRASKFASQLDVQVENLRNLYRFYEKGENVLEKVHYKEQNRERQLDDLVRMQYVQAAAPSALSASVPGGFAQASTTAAKPSSTFGFFGSSTPAPSTSFGTSGSAPLSLGGQGTAAPAGVAFGSSTSPTPAPGSSFAPSASSFSVSSTPKSKSKSRSKTRSSR